MRYVAIINVPGYLPETKPEHFDSAEDAWRYLISELERDGLAWEPDDENDPEGPQSRTATALELERYAEQARVYGRVGTVYGPSTLDRDRSHDLGLAYSVDYAEDDDEDEECEGHESLSGADMGRTVYCDGSCR